MELFAEFVFSTLGNVPGKWPLKNSHARQENLVSFALFPDTYEENSEICAQICTHCVHILNSLYVLLEELPYFSPCWWYRCTGWYKSMISGPSQSFSVMILCELNWSFILYHIVLLFRHKKIAMLTHLSISESTCTLCYDRDANAIIDPCGHR